MNLDTIYIIIAIICWGIWGVLNKAAQLKISPFQVMAMVAFTDIFLFPLYLLCMRKIDQPFQFNSGIVYGMLSCIVGGLATLFYTMALNGNRSVGTVVGLAATYPAVTFLFAIFIFNETITIQKIAGLLMILSGIFILGR